MKFHVFLTPMHVAEIECDMHDQVSGVHRFVKDDKVIAEFANCVGWMQIMGSHLSPTNKASVTQLSVVSNGQPPPTAT